jgi:hypothetical protein
MPKLTAPLLAMVATGALHGLTACETRQAPSGPSSAMLGPEGQTPGGSASVEPGPDGTCDMTALMALPENGCTNAGCHGQQFQGNLDLSSPGVEQRLVGVRSQTAACGGELLVDPTNPENSLLLRVIDPVRFQAAPCGVMMPFGSSSGVSATTLGCFERWVRDMGEVPTTSEPPVTFEAVQADSYVNKVKTLLTGAAASPHEIALVAADAGSLRGLVAGWLQTPEFTPKLADFLRVALQQKLVGSLNSQFNVLRGNKLNALKENLQESFVRTATAIVQDGRPFTEVLTTRRWMVTTATLAALAYLESTQAELKREQHRVFRDPGDGLPIPPVSLEYSVANHVWHLPGLPTTCEVSQINADFLFEMLLGFVNCKGTGQYRFDDTLLSDADFADWRTVEIQVAATKAQVPLFYDLAALRGVTSVQLRQPRAGFFTTPAFLANWETNEDNQFRVTTSQAVIAALGKIFSPADPTQPVRLDGLAKEHAASGTACYGCHQFLDPMRSYFAHSFSYTFQRADELGQLTPSFAFHGYVHDGGQLDDFAQALAEHPGFAMGWTQKLCFWANSQPCSEKDPETMRVAQVFADSGFDLKALLVELLSSPLVTGAQDVATFRDTPPFVSITRKQHLCRLLDTRLGVVDACGVAAGFAGLVPEDEFSRGAAEPVQTAVTGLFHYAAVEKLCSRLATKLVGGAANMPLQASQPEVVLDTLVEELMGLAPGNARRDGVRAKLAQHYAEAKESTNQQTALRSAFVVACVSPEVQAVGL